MGLICTVPRRHLLGHRLICPGHSAQYVSACLDIYRVYRSLQGSLFELGKLHWFLYLTLSYFYHPKTVGTVGDDYRKSIQ